MLATRSYPDRHRPLGHGSSPSKNPSAHNRSIVRSLQPLTLTQHPTPPAGLTKSFAGGTIFCSPISARLLVRDMGIPGYRVQPIPMNAPTLIDRVEVTPLDANHCPGAVMFLFKVPGAGPGGKAQVRVQTGACLL